MTRLQWSLGGRILWLRSLRVLLIWASTPASAIYADELTRAMDDQNLVPTWRTTEANLLAELAIPAPNPLKLFEMLTRNRRFWLRDSWLSQRSGQWSGSLGFEVHVAGKRIRCADSKRTVILADVGEQREHAVRAQSPVQKSAASGHVVINSASDAGRDRVQSNCNSLFRWLLPYRYSIYIPGGTTLVPPVA